MSANVSLNPQQEEVASHVTGRILTLAGPGSGKTKTLTERTGRLIKKGANPASILCLTFTNKARDEMRQRIATVHGPAAARVFISNFHGLCGIALRKFGTQLGYGDRLTIIDSDDQIDLLLQLCRKRGIEASKPQARTLAYVVNEWRENLGTEADLVAYTRRIEDRELFVVREYMIALRQRNQTDFSGLLSETVRLLRDVHEVRERLQKRFHFIQVDEFQDTNRAQNEIVELLAGSEDNVLAVGDGDQSIYEWRGASPEGIPNFIRNGERKTGACKVVKLGVNYRSTPEVVAVADKLIRHCRNRIPVEFSTVHRSGEPVKCFGFKTPEDEADVIAKNVDTLRAAGQHLREVAVFYRTNDMSRAIEQALAKRRIAYQVIGGGSYYDRMEVKDVLSMLRFICNPHDGISFARVANKPARGMGDALIGKIEAFAEREGTDLLTAMSEENLVHVRDEAGKPISGGAVMAVREVRDVFGFETHGRTVAAIANEVLVRSRYDEWLRAKYGEKGNEQEYEERRRNVRELLNSIETFSRDNPRASVADYLQSISLYTDGDERQTEEAVRLMSLHSSKGLEFDVVYVIGVEEKILPHEKAVLDRGTKGLDEERRLCYVGFTRAKKMLRVTYCKTRQDVMARGGGGGGKARWMPTVPSRFLVEAGLVSEEERKGVLNEARRGARG